MRDYRAFPGEECKTPEELMRKIPRETTAKEGSVSEIAATAPSALAQHEFPEGAPLTPAEHVVWRLIALRDRLDGKTDRLPPRPTVAELPPQTPARIVRFINLVSRLLDQVDERVEPLAARRDAVDGVFDSGLKEPLQVP
jgi:hypothetical protein